MAISAVFELFIGLPDLSKARFELTVPGLDRCKLLFKGLSHLLELAAQRVDSLCEGHDHLELRRLVISSSFLVFATLL